MNKLLLSAAIALALPALPAVADPPGGLPPGLEKKVERGGELPPGWDKKLRVGDYLDRDIYAHGRIVIPVDDDGLVTVEIGTRVLRLMQDSLRVDAIIR